MPRVVRDEIVCLAKSASHEHLPALYDQTIGEFYFRPGNASAEPAQSASPPLTATAPATVPIHVRTARELEQSFLNRSKDSTDAADFSDYLTPFPKRVHAAEASLTVRKSTRAATAYAAEPPASNAATDTTAAQPPPGGASGSGGPVPGYITSTLIPGVNMAGTFLLNCDGTFGYRGSDGARLRRTLNVSKPKAFLAPAPARSAKNTGSCRRSVRTESGARRRTCATGSPTAFCTAKTLIATKPASSSSRSDAWTEPRCPVTPFA